MKEDSGKPLEIDRHPPSGGLALKTTGDRPGGAIRM